MPFIMLWGINPNFSGLSPSAGQVTYALRTRAPVSVFRKIHTPRLACVKPPASVHPEPGSNSPLLKIFDVFDVERFFLPFLELTVFSLGFFFFFSIISNELLVFFFASIS